MPLPTISTPIYELVVPSSKKKIKYRPFLVKEQKILLIALETQDDRQILDAIIQIFENCIVTPGFKVDSLALFDIEYIFLNMRARSVEEQITMNIVCPDDGETEISVSILIDDIKVDFPKGHKKEIKLDDNTLLVMKYPNFDYFAQVNFSPETPDPYELVASCIDKVFVGEDLTDDFSFEEAKEWVETMTNHQFEKIQEFFNTMPALRHTFKVKNPNTQVNNDITIQGLANFFA
jgi:hypothetical protein